jgi:hypothetical protein
MKSQGGGSALAKASKFLSGLSGLPVGVLGLEARASCLECGGSGSMGPNSSLSRHVKVKAWQRLP